MALKGLDLAALSLERHRAPGPEKNAEIDSRNRKGEVTMSIDFSQEETQQPLLSTAHLGEDEGEYVSASPRA